MNALAAHDLHSLADLLGQWGYARSHAPRILREFYDASGQHTPRHPSFGPRLCHRLSETFPVLTSEVVGRHVSQDGTTKLLIGLHDGKIVESVLMPAHRPDRAAGCLSSQVGCAMGCDFCASTRNGFVRNLESHEIVEQFLFLKTVSEAQGRRLRSLVFMGMGEPLLNLDNVLSAIRRIADPAMGALGWRQVTVSTVGIVPGINRLIEADLNIHLAVSLHAPDDETRSRLIPVNRRWPIREIIDATRRFAEQTGRIPTIEYTMLSGVNDSEAQAGQLVHLLSDLRAHVNLIPYNAIGAGLSGVNYARPSADRMLAFLSILQTAGVVAHFRETRGDDVAAACGQLAGQGA